MNAFFTNKFEMIIYLIGLMGSGKSYFGKQWAEAYKLDFYDLDELIVHAEDLSISNIFETKGEQYFRKIESKELHKTVHFKNAIVACGGGTPCFYDNMSWMNTHGTTIFFDFSLDYINSNLRNQKAHRPLIASLSHENLFEFLANQYQQRESTYKLSKHIFANPISAGEEFKKLITTLK